LKLQALEVQNPSGSFQKKFPWLKQITSLPLSLHGGQVSKLLLQTMKAEAHPALPFTPSAKADNPRRQLMPRAGASSRELMLPSQVLGLNYLHLPNVPGRVFRGPWGWWGHHLRLKSPG